MSTPEDPRPHAATATATADLGAGRARGAARGDPRRDRRTGRRRPSLGDFSIAPGAVARVARLPKALFLVPVVVVLVVASPPWPLFVAPRAAATATTAASSSEQVAGATCSRRRGTTSWSRRRPTRAAAPGSSTRCSTRRTPSCRSRSTRPSKREESWYWDGSDLRSTTSRAPRRCRGSTSRGVDGAVARRPGRPGPPARRGPDHLVRIVRAPDADQAMVWAYATNEYGETAYLGARPTARSSTTPPSTDAPTGGIPPAGGVAPV